MTKRYTEDDLRRLVEVASRVTQLPGDGYAVDDAALGHLRTALAPFLPDPEDALIERMAQEMQDRLKSGGGMGKDWHRVTARAALDVVKREGLPT